MEALTSQQLSYEADLLSAWAGEEIMWEPGQPDDPITLGAMAAARQRGAPAAALLASLPHYGPAGQAGVAAAESVFSSPSALAAGLGHRKGRPPGRPFDT